MTREEAVRCAVAQPLDPFPAPFPAPPRRVLRNWSEKQRSTAVETLRYSYFVSWMKRLLPVGAVALIASVIAYWVIPRSQDKLSFTMQQSENLANDLTMTKPRFTGEDGKGNPFTVTAAEAVQDPRNHHRIKLKKVDADMQFDSRSWLNATAASGTFDVDAGTLKLTGGLSLFTDNGYELHTDGADVYLRTNIVEGSQPVTGHGPLGSLRADRFHFDRLKRQVKLHGHVQMTMYPKRTNG